MSPVTCLLATLAMTAGASPLLRMPEPRPGLLGDATAFAKIEERGHIGAPGRGFAGHLRTIQRHYLSVEGHHPPIYYFFCTVYYTPRQSGFTAARGFDMTPDRRLGGRILPRDFARAVRMEGAGRLAEPAAGGRTHVNYLGKYWDHPLGNRNNTLVPRKSAAVHRHNPLFRRASPLRVLDPAVHRCFGTTSFETADTGGGLYRSQIDLYWGEDDPRGPDDIFRPASCDFDVRWIVPVIVGK